MATDVPLPPSSPLVFLVFMSPTAAKYPDGWRDWAGGGNGLGWRIFKHEDFLLLFLFTFKAQEDQQQK